jgi:NADH dehydrogenase
LEKIHQIVIVGGGAGGLELATKLGNSLGKRKLAEIILIDAKKTHVWKPLLHEIAAGSLNPDKDELEYIAQAHWHHFKFRFGRVNSINSKSKTISIEPTIDTDGSEIIPKRKIYYDTLVMSVGSTVNDFNIEGTKDYAVTLDTQDQADKFHQKLHNSILRAQTQQGPVKPGQLEVVIVGAGATGVELAAELHKATREMTAYGLDRIKPDRDIKIHLMEASSRLLPALPRSISASVEKELHKLNVKIFLDERVTKVTKNGIETSSGKKILSSLVVWAAGIKAPKFLAEIKGIETNSINQIKVNSTLQSTLNEDIFAFGDCASCPIHPGSEESVPPRAQAAHQQANLLFKSLSFRVLKPTKKLPKYIYKDYGSLVNLGKYSTVGNLMGSLLGGSMFVEGLIARTMYLMLYQMHLSALHGNINVILRLLSKAFSRRTEARVKLH